MKLLKFFTYLLLGIFLMPATVYSQQRKIDSLYTLLKTEKEDTNKVKNLNKLAYFLYNSKPDSTILLAQQASALAIKLGWIKGEAISAASAGIGYLVKGDYSNALINQQKALKLTVEIGDKRGQAANLGNIANIYYYQGEYPKALDYDLQALKIAEEMGNKQLQATSLGNVGNVYFSQSDYPKALNYDQKALSMVEEIGDKHGQARNLGNIGGIYYLQGDYAKALTYAMRSLKMNEELGNKEVQVNNLGLIAAIYDKQGDYPRSLDYYLKTMKMAEQTGNKNQIASTLSNLGSFYTKTGRFKESEDYLKKAIVLDSSIGDKNDLKRAEVDISNLYDTIGHYKLALMWYKKAMILKDTLFNIEKGKALTRKELSYEYEKKEVMEKAEQAQKDLMVAADKKKQQTIIWSVCGGLLLVLVFLGILFNRFRIIQKQKTVIEEQKVLVEEKNKEVLDSITYAKHLQDAILPSLSIIKKYLPDFFLLYKPKDIVAGDFYWMERSPLNPPERRTKDSGIPPLEGGEAILIAACDCTGHGVPGAMVSVVCSNALNRTVKEFKITEPGKILDKVRELVLETFEKSESEVQDGMDISLCCLNTQTKEIQWSGANNPLWYIQNGELKEVLPDKQPIGKQENPKSFNTHSLKLKKGDILYLFTDGYADQFGGPKGKKFKYKQLQEKLLAMASMNMDKQKEMLDETIESWKGNLEQVDDILIMGIRV